VLVALCLWGPAYSQTTKPASGAPQFAPRPRLVDAAAQTDLAPFPFVHGDSTAIWIARYVDRTPRAAAGARGPFGFEVGTLRLDVVQVLHGDPATTKAVLPYSFVTQLPANATNVGRPTVWPDLRDVPAGTLFLVLVYTRGFYDPGAGILPDVPQTAGVVYRISGADDPIVETYKRILAIDAQTGDDLYGALMKAVADDDPLVRKYGIESAAPAWNTLSNEQALPLLRRAVEQARRFKLTGDAEAFAAYTLRTRLGAPGVTTADRLTVINDYARLASSGDAEQRDFFVLQIFELPDKIFNAVAAAIDPSVRIEIRNAAVASANNPASGSDPRLPQFCVELINRLDAPTTQPIRP
jgi:hypothetical protein